MEFSVIPMNMKDLVTKDIKVLSQERIIGYNALVQDKDMIMDNAGSDYYNVTVSMVVKKGSDYSS